MSSPGTETPSPVGSSRRTEVPPIYRWHVWPLADDPSSAAVKMTLGLLVAIIVGAVLSNWVWSLAAAAIMAASAWRLFVPVTYEVGPSGVAEEAFTRRRETRWSSLARYVTLRDAVVLWTTPRTGPLGGPRRICLPLGQHYMPVMEQIHLHLDTLRQPRARGSSIEHDLVLRATEPRPSNGAPAGGSQSSPRAAGRASGE